MSPSCYQALYSREEESDAKGAAPVTGADEQRADEITSVY